MQFGLRRPGTVTFVSAVALVALAGACFAAGGAWLGVVLQPLTDELKQAMDIDEDVTGVLVGDVVDESPADEFGIEKGDVIISIGDDETSTLKGALRTLKAYSPGDDVDVVVLRGGDKRRVITVELGEREKDKIVDLDLDFDVDEIPDIARAFEGWMDGPRGFLGVQIQEMSRDLAEYFDVDEDEGVLVLEVTEGSPAEEAGLRAGDVILEFDGKEVNDTDRLVKYVRAADPGDKVEIKIKRKRRTQTLTAELGQTEGMAKVYVQDLMDGGKRRRIMMPRGHDLKMPDIDEIKIHKLHQDDLREELEQLREELEDLKEDLREIRES